MFMSQACCLRVGSRVLAVRRVHFGRVQDSLKKYMRWYPQDTITYSNIETYMELSKHTSSCQTILVGVVYEDENVRSKSKVLDTLLADPLASGNEAWYRPLEARSRAENNLIMYPSDEAPELLLPGSFQRTVTKYEPKAPLLSPNLRPTFPEALPPLDSKANNIALLEINKQDDVAKLVDVCHFYIYITAELSTLMDSMPRQVQKKILLTVVDNSEYSPRSTEATPPTFRRDDAVTHHVIKVNSLILLRGIDAFLKLDTEAALQYFESLQTSNILEVAKLIVWFTRSENLLRWVFQIIKSEVSTNTLSETQITNIYEDLRLSSLAKFSSEMHSELQHTFIPETTAFFRKKLPWWMLYLRNDNVEYLVKDYFNAHFMNKSIDGYNYLKGQLVARLQDQKYAAYSDADKLQVQNPLQQFKLDLINNRVGPEVQLVVYLSIVAGLVYYQLPLSALSLVGYLWFNIQGQTAIALTALGWALGFNHVSKAWHDFTSKWLHNLFEQVRIVIAKGCMDQGLLKELNTRFEGAKDLARIKKQVVDELNAADKE